MKPSAAIEEVRRVCRFKHYALATEENYTHWVRRFFVWLADHPSVSTEPAARMEAYLSDLARSDVSATTQNQAFSAILFFYRHVIKQEPGNVDALRARRPARMRHAPCKADVARLLSAVEDSPAYPFRLICAMLYGCGLRVSEPLAIRIRDLDLGNGRMIIREAKGNKDRMVPVPSILVDPINRQIAASRVVFQRSLDAGIPAKLPHQLSRKYRSAGHQFSWWWLFPMPGPCNDPRTGDQVWWHCLPTGVQKALRKAASKTGLDGFITPHHLRHAWATHALDAGACIRDLQEILGHKSLETTMIYTHPQIDRVPSPLLNLNIAI